jgi:aminoglycoside 3-N-acetyltransferase
VSGYVPIEAVLREIKCKRGGAVLVASDLLAWAAVALEYGEALRPDDVIDHLLAQVQSIGTLLFPAFNYGFTSAGRFDVRRTPPVTGALPRAALKRPEFRRTRHPIHSFAVAGAERDALCAMENLSSFGPDSPFAWMRERHAQMWIIGLGYKGSFTIAHHAEELEGAPYRYLKWFEGKYIDEYGVESQRRYSMYVRDLERGVVADLAPMGEEFEARGVGFTRIFNGVPFRCVPDLVAAYDLMVQDLRTNGGRKMHRASS